MRVFLDRMATASSRQGAALQGRFHWTWRLRQLPGRDMPIHVDLPIIPGTDQQKAYCHACQSRADTRARDKNCFALSVSTVFSDRVAWRSLHYVVSIYLRRRCRRPPPSSVSAPVIWSTTFMDRRTFPRSSIPRNLTLTSWPSLRTSDGCPKRRLAIWLM